MVGIQVELKNINLTLNRHKILENINFQIESGKTATLIGPSGSGKSSLLRTINRIYEPTSGDILLNHKSILKINPNKLRQKIGMVFQSYNLFPNFDVKNNITIALRKIKKIPKTKATNIALEKLRLVGLEHKANANIKSLSGGEQQRVAIARSLAMEPQVILFDEVTSALDPELVKSVLDLITNLTKSKITNIIVTHEMHFAKRVSDIIYFMDQGKIIEFGSPEKIFNSPNNERCKKFLAQML